MTNWVPVPTQTVYELPIPLDDFKCILKHEQDGSDFWMSDDFNVIDGVDWYDWSGHLGSSIFYRVDRDYDSAELHNRIIQTVSNAVSRAIEWELSQSEAGVDTAP